tara:strand:- start:429 stop:617 length:189 start_codon:yes stop_codon:yes gene_type:complete
MWEGTSEEVITILESNRHNPQDKQLQEVEACPTCRKTDTLVNVDSENRRIIKLHILKIKHNE